MFIDTLKKYGILPERYLGIARLIATKEGYDPNLLHFSKNPKKKLEYGGREFGADGYMDYILYQIMTPELAEKKRKNYRARARRTAEKTNDKFSPANLSLNILW